MGLAVARALAAAGATVAICGRNRTQGAHALEQIAAAGGAAEFFCCDITQAGQVKEMIEQIVARHGRLDCAFNNAGVTAKHAPVADASVEDWRSVIDVNLTGTFHCMKYELQAMSRGAGGAIVNNSSCAGVLAIPNQAAYVASKFAIIGLTQSAAIEYAKKRDGSAVVRINAIAPGPILGGMNSEQNLLQNPERTQRKIAVTAMGRFGDPEEVAASVLWLLCEESSYITGSVIPVDGGTTAGKF